MNYYEIGQRIRSFRKKRSLSQEELAEKVNISVTHMSHIETGNTKLSLPVLVAISEVLEVRIDDLIYASAQTDTNTIIEDIVSDMRNCNSQQIMVIRDIIKTARISMNKHITKTEM